MQKPNENENSEELENLINKQPSQMVENKESKKLVNQNSFVCEPSAVDSMQQNNQQPQQISFNTYESFYINQHQDFEQFRINSQIMVDKSLIIKQILSKPRLCITRPRRWGKSLNLSLLKYFFKLPTDKNGKLLKENPYSYLFKGGAIPRNILRKYNIQQRILDPLKINFQQKIMQRHHGKYIVIFLDFSLLKDKHYEQVCSLLQGMVKQIYNEYSFLAQTQYSRQYRQMKEKLQKKQKLYGAFLKNLCQIIFNLYETLIIVLVDEFDAPFNSFNLKKEEIKQIRSLISGTLQPLSKVTKGIRNLIMTGILINSVNLNESGLNNVLFEGIIRSDFLSEYYGFSLQQIQQQLLYKIVRPSKQKKSISLFLKRIKQWYNGYQCQKANGEKMKIYNAWSITRYLNKCINKKIVFKGSSFWASSSNTQLIFKIFDKCYYQNKFQKIFKILNSSQCCYCRSAEARQLQQQVKLKMSKQIKCTKHIHKISQIVIKKFQYQQWQMKDLVQLTQVDEFYLLINLGYLTAKITEDIYQAYIPNKQIRNALTEIFKDWHKFNNIGYQFTTINILDTKSFVEQMSKFYQKYNKNIVQINQKIINSIFSVLYSMSSFPTHRIGEQIYSGSGYIDNVFLPKQNTNTTDYWAVIHQYKYVQNQTHAQFIKSVIQCFYQIFSKLYIKRISEICPHASVKICAIIVFWEKGKSQTQIRHFQLDITQTQAKKIIQKFQKVMKELAKIVKDPKTFARYCCQEYLQGANQQYLDSFIRQKFIDSSQEELNKLIAQCSEKKTHEPFRGRGQSPQDTIQKKRKN